MKSTVLPEKKNGSYCSGCSHLMMRGHKNCTMSCQHFVGPNAIVRIIHATWKLVGREEIVACQLNIRIKAPSATRLYRTLLRVVNDIKYQRTGILRTASAGKVGDINDGHCVLTQKRISAVVAREPGRLGVRPISRRKSWHL